MEQKHLNKKDRDTIAALPPKQRKEARKALRKERGLKVYT